MMSNNNTPTTQTKVRREYYEWTTKIMHTKLSKNQQGLRWRVIAPTSGELRVVGWRDTHNYASEPDIAIAH